MALNRLDPEILQFRSEDLGLLGIKTRLLPTGYYKSAEWTAQIAEIHLITDFRPFLYLRNSHPFNYCWKVKRKCVKLTWREVNFQVGLTCFWTGSAQNHRSCKWTWRSPSGYKGPIKNCSNPSNLKIFQWKKQKPNNILNVSFGFPTALGFLNVKTSERFHFVTSFQQ